MYDEKYLSGSDVKKIETFEDAVAIVVVHGFCGAIRCETCPIRMYEVVKGNGCADVFDKAKEVLAENGADCNCNDQGASLYNTILQMESAKHEPALIETKATTTCAACIHSQEHTSGILWCKSFGNFVHSDGHCYRYVDAEVPLDV